MMTSRCFARGLLFLSVTAVLLSSAHGQPNLDIAFPTPTPAPHAVARQLFPIGGKDSGSVTATATDTGTAIATGTATGTGSGTGTGVGTGVGSATGTGAASDANGSTSDTSAATGDPSKPTDSASGNAPGVTSASLTGSATSATGSDSNAQNPATPSSPTPTLSATPSVSQSLSTNAAGEQVTVMVTVTPSLTSDSASASNTAGSDQSGNNTKPSEGISKSTIIGLSVAGGVALIGIITFVVWKFTRKRFTDDDFDNEAIKWPELNTHGEEPSHALPTNRTGGAGFETSSQVNLTRPDSRAGSVAPSAAGSTVDLYASRDPYAVPPLPHLNPNVTQPYRDDPSGVYYDNDPYATASASDAIPMTQINRGRSPAPQLAYGYVDGRASPGPHQTLGVDPRVMSPGPGSLYGGHTSPAPPAAGRMSPGPQAAYGPGPGY